MFIYKYAAPRNFYHLAGLLIPVFAVLTVVLLAIGLYMGFFVSPPDYEQGETVRIMFIHVPAAWMSMFIYAVMAASGAAGLIWKTKTAHIFAAASAPVGATFTVIALITGSLWGAPMWGTWWEWTDARLTSELFLLFLFFGYIALRGSIDDPQRADRAAAILAVVGIVNLPIIHFSVEWWNTLHQPASVSKVGRPSIHSSMLIPLLCMALAFKTYFLANTLIRARTMILTRERSKHWVAELLDRRQNQS